MARLHHLVSRALASQHLLLPYPTASSLRPLAPRPPIPPLSPPPSSLLRGRTLIPFSVAASRKYASSTFGRRRRASSPPMLLRGRRRRARRPTRKGPGELSVQIGIEEDLPDDPEILVISSVPMFHCLTAYRSCLQNFMTFSFALVCNVKIALCLISIIVNGCAEYCRNAPD